MKMPGVRFGLALLVLMTAIGALMGVACGGGTKKPSPTAVMTVQPALALTELPRSTGVVTAQACRESDSGPAYQWVTTALPPPASQSPDPHGGDALVFVVEPGKQPIGAYQTDLRGVRLSAWQGDSQLVLTAGGSRMMSLDLSLKALAPPGEVASAVENTRYLPSPDGSYLLLVREGGVIQLIDRAGGVRTLAGLTPQTVLGWIPDNSGFLILMLEEGSPGGQGARVDVGLISTCDGQARVVSHHTINRYVPYAWSPDHSMLATTDGNTVLVLDTKTLQVVFTTTGMGGSWTGDGTKLRVGMDVFDVTTGKLFSRVPHPEASLITTDNHFYLLRESPGSSYNGPPGLCPDRVNRIYAYDTATAERRTIVDCAAGLTAVYDPADKGQKRSGNTVLLAKFPSTGKGPVTLSLLDVGSATSTRLGEIGSDCVPCYVNLSPDGSKLLVIIGNDIDVFDIDGHLLQVVSPPPNYRLGDTSPRPQAVPLWSPDGSRFAYVVNGPY